MTSRSRNDPARLLRDEREREIEEAYRRRYGAAPQEDWLGEAGLTAFVAFVETEEHSEERL